MTALDKLRQGREWATDLLPPLSFVVPSDDRLDGDRVYWLTRRRDQAASDQERAAWQSLLDEPTGDQHAQP